MLERVIAVARFTCLEAVRNRLIWLLLAMLLIAVGIGEFAASIAITESQQVRSALLASLVRLFAVFLVSLFVATSMVREFADKNFDLVLALPLPRWLYYAGKLLGFSLVCAAIAGVIGCLLLWYAPFAQVAIWSVSLGCELIIVGSMCLLCMFTFTQLPTAIAVVASFYALARSIDALVLISHGPLINTDLWSNQLIIRMLDAIAFLLPSLDRFTMSEWLIYHTAHWTDLLPIVGQTLVYVTLIAGASLTDLYRRNL